jgi:glycosyltransferase involved in cell wall biosynthesis
MTRAARTRRVFFVEEPVFDAPAGQPSVTIREPLPNVRVVVPHLVPGSPEAVSTRALQDTMDELLRTFDVTRYVLWYWTPMSLSYTRHLTPTAVVFDCMDELAGFAGAPPALKEMERELMRRAHVMFTGGASLYEAKRSRHDNVHAFPSSVDVAHFARAARVKDEPDDQARIPHPRIGYFGVIDERMDLDLLAGIADRRPDWHLVLVGPTCKIDAASLPTRDNIHYLGMKSYEQLPEYLAGWDVAMLPFARNEATRFISPTKTPEYLAAGRPVVSTSIRDVVRPYAELGLVHIADDADRFVAAIDAAMAEDAFTRQAKVQACLAGQSWDATWDRMDALLSEACAASTALPATIASVARV